MQGLRPEDSPGVCHAFGLSDQTGPMTAVARGELGRVWCLPTRAGRIAVKEVFRPPSEDDAAGDVAFQMLAGDAGVLRPDPVLTPEGHVLVTLASGVVVRAYAWVDLRPLGERPVELIAGVLARLHLASPPVDTAPHAFFTEPVGPKRWAASVRAVMDAPFAVGFAGLVTQVVALESLLPVRPRGDERRCHLDLDDSNLGWDAVGRLVVLDWENSGPCSAARDLAMLAAEYGAERGGRLVRDYIAAGGPARLTQADDFATAIAFQSNLLDHHVRRWRDGDAEDRQRAQSSLSALVEWPLVTFERIDAVLAACASAVG